MSAWRRADPPQITTIKTNLLDDDGEGGETSGFSWIDDYRIQWRKKRTARSRCSRSGSFLADGFTTPF